VPDLQQEIQETVSADSTIVACVIVTGTRRGEFVGATAEGKHFDIDQTTFVHFRDRKAEEIWEVADTASLSQAARRLVKR